MNESPAQTLVLDVRVPRQCRDELSERLLGVGFPGVEFVGDHAGADLDAAAPLDARKTVRANPVEESNETLVRIYLAPQMGMEDAKLCVRQLTRRVCGFSSPVVETPLLQDWKLAWTKHLKSVRLSANTKLVPWAPTSTRSADELYLRPALAFGFGEHATTRMAVRFVEKYAGERRVLDVGTGTGVLALVAARAGARTVVGLDIDKLSIEAAQDNAYLNQLGDTVSWHHGSIDEIIHDFDVVVANIGVTELVGMCRTVAARVSRGGMVGLTGVLCEHTEEVVAAYASAGVRLGVAESEQGWALLVGARAPGNTVPD